MIVTGRPTSRASALAAYLARADWSQQAEVAELSGVAAGDLRGALCEMEAVALGATCRRPLYHASISPPPDAELTPGQWEQAVTRLEEGLRVTGQPRALVFHVKGGRRHLHAVWLRVHADSMRVISCAHDRLTHRTVARQLEQEFGHAPPRSVAATRQGAAPTWAELRRARCAGIDLDSVGWVLAHAWRADDFAQAVRERSSMILARGDRGGAVVVDEEGGVYSVARRLGAAVSKTELRARLASLAYVPSVAAARDEQYHYMAGRALGADLSRQDREEAEAPVIAAARAVLDRGLERLRTCSTADADGDAGHQDSATMQRRHLAWLAGRLALARRLVEALTDSPDGWPDLAQFVTLPDELLWQTGEDPELCVGPVWTLLERLRRAGVQVECRAGPGQRHVATCPRAEIVAVLLGAGRPGSPMAYDLVDMLAEALPTSRRLGAVVAGTPDELSALCAMSRTSDEKRARRHGARQQVGRNARATMGVAPDGAGDAGTVEWLLTDGEAIGQPIGAPMSRLVAALREGQVPVVIEPVAEQPGQAHLRTVRVSIAALVEHVQWLWEAARDAAEALLRLLRDATSVTRRRDQGRRIFAQQARGPEGARAPDAGAPHVRVGGPGMEDGRSTPGDTAPVQMAAPGMSAARSPETTLVPGMDEADRAVEATQRARDADTQRRNDRIAARAQWARDAQIAADPVLRAALAEAAAARLSPPTATSAAGAIQPRQKPAEQAGRQPAPPVRSGPSHGQAAPVPAPGDAHPGRPSVTGPPVLSPQARADGPAKQPPAAVMASAPETAAARTSRWLQDGVRASQERRGTNQVLGALYVALDQRRAATATQAPGFLADEPTPTAPKRPAGQIAADRPDTTSQQLRQIPQAAPVVPATQQARAVTVTEPRAAARLPTAATSTPLAPAQGASVQRQVAPGTSIAGRARAGTTQEAQDQLRRQLLEACDVIHIDADGKASDELASNPRPTLRLFTLSQVHEGATKPDRAGKIGLPGLGAALADVGVPARTVPQRNDLIAVLIDVEALAAALARLTQAEVELWLARLRHAAQQSRNLHRFRTTPRKDRGSGLA